MITPRTTIDTRFSDPEATATPWSETQRVLETAELFWITTVRVDGRPHVTPLVAVWLDDSMHFSTGETEQKAMNLRDNRHVVLTTGCNTWTEGLDVVIEGDAAALPMTPCYRGWPRRGRTSGTDAGTTSSGTAASSIPEAARMPWSSPWRRRRCSPSAREPSRTRRTDSDSWAPLPLGNVAMAQCRVHRMGLIACQFRRGGVAAQGDRTGCSRALAATARRGSRLHGPRTGCTRARVQRAGERD